MGSTDTPKNSDQTPQETSEAPPASPTPPAPVTAPTSVMALILEALALGIKTKPVKYVSTMAVCVLVIGFVIWTAVVAWIDLKDRMHRSEQQLETVSEEVSRKSDRIEEIENKASEVDVVKAATEDASMIQNTRVEWLEAELEILQKEMEIAKKKDKGEPTVVDTVSKAATVVKAEAIKSSRRKPESDAVLEDGVIDYDRARDVPPMQK